MTIAAETSRRPPASDAKPTRKVAYLGLEATVRRELPGNRLDLETNEGIWCSVVRHRGIHRGPGGWQPLPVDSDKPSEEPKP
jgi:hypothetical protein